MKLEVMSVNHSKYWFVLAIILPLFCSAQSLEEDIKAISDKLSSSEGYTIESVVKVYASKGGSLVHQMKASVLGNKTASFTVMGEVEIFASDQYMIVIDTDEKLMEVQQLNTPKKSNGRHKGKESLKLDELEKLAKSDSGLKFTLSSTNGNIRTYTASNVKMGINSMVIKLDFAEKRILSYAVENLDENGKVEQYILVDYTKFSYTINQQETLKYTHFVLKEGDGYKPASAYKGKSFQDG